MQDFFSPYCVRIMNYDGGKLFVVTIMQSCYYDLVIKENISMELLLLRSKRTF